MFKVNQIKFVPSEQNKGISLFKSLREELTNKGLDELILHYAPMAIGMGRKFARYKEKDADEYISVALLALVEGVHNAYRYMTHDNIDPYIGAYIKRAILKFYGEDRTVSIPQRTYSRFFRLGYLVQIEVRPLEQEDASIITSNDLLEALMEVVPDLIDRQVLTLRLQRHTDKEISLLLDKDITIIRSIRNRLKKLLTEILEDE